MRVAVYYRNNDVRTEERPCPAIGPGEILMRVEASGICGSDVMEWYRGPKAPLVLGHEVAGTVEEVGAGIDGFATGDRIVTTHHVPCNRCRYCLTDRQSNCRTLHSTSFDPGGFAEFVRLPAINVERGTFRLPDDIGFDEGTFVEPLACVVRGQRVTGVRPGDTVAVLGSGVSGVLHIQLARALGASRVFATDTNEFRVQSACSFGADLSLHADEDVIGRVRAANGGRLVDRVLICAAARQAVDQALALVDDGGSVLFFATLEPGEEYALPLNDLWKRGITLTHSYAGPPADMLAALDLIESRRVDVASMVTHRLGLEETAKGFRLMTEPGKSLKVIVQPQR